METVSNWMLRPGRMEVLIRHAQLESQRGTCSRLQVGAIIHRDGRILSTGYNGAPAGVDHCNHQQNDGPCTRACHAERNAIDWAARYGIALLGAELVTTDTPCAQCAGSIINAGIKSVVAVRPYRDQTGVEWLQQAGVSMILAREVI